MQKELKLMAAALRAKANMQTSTWKMQMHLLPVPNAATCCCVALLSQTAVVAVVVAVSAGLRAGFCLHLYNGWFIKTPETCQRQTKRKTWHKEQQKKREKINQAGNIGKIRAHTGAIYACASLAVCVCMCHTCCTCIAFAKCEQQQRALQIRHAQRAR